MESRPSPARARTSARISTRRSFDTRSGVLGRRWRVPNPYSRMRDRVVRETAKHRGVRIVRSRAITAAAFATRSPSEKSSTRSSTISPPCRRIISSGITREVRAHLTTSASLCRRELQAGEGFSNDSLSPVISKFLRCASQRQRLLAYPRRRVRFICQRPSFSHVAGSDEAACSRSSVLLRCQARCGEHRVGQFPRGCAFLPRAPARPCPFFGIDGPERIEAWAQTIAVGSREPSPVASACAIAV